MLVWLSGARCRYFAYGPADATAVPEPLHLLSYLIQTGLPFWYWLTQVVLEKEAVKQVCSSSTQARMHTHTHTRLTARFSGTTRWAGIRKVKPIWTLLKQETVSGSGTSWDIYKSATRSRQITTPAPHHSVFYRLDALPAAQPTASTHWRQMELNNDSKIERRSESSSVRRCDRRWFTVRSSWRYGQCVCDEPLRTG